MNISILTIICLIPLIYNIYRLSIISDNFAQKCLVAITIIDKSKIVLSDNDNDKNLSIDNYRSIIIADNAHHCLSLVVGGMLHFLSSRIASRTPKITMLFQFCVDSTFHCVCRLLLACTSLLVKIFLLMR